jgi:hypothetical protein
MRSLLLVESFDLRTYVTGNRFSPRDVKQSSKLANSATGRATKADSTCSCILQYLYAVVTGRERAIKCAPCWSGRDCVALTGSKRCLLRDEAASHLSHSNYNKARSVCYQQPASCKFYIYRTGFL